MAKKTVEEKEKELLAKAEKLKLAQKKIKEAQAKVEREKLENLSKVIVDSLGKDVEPDFLKQVIFEGLKFLKPMEENKPQVVTPEAVHQNDGFQQNRY